VNPYDAPQTPVVVGPTLPAWIAPVLRAALTVIALDFGRGVVWRVATASGLSSDRYNPNVITQLVFAIALVFAVAVLTRRRDESASPPLRIATIAASIAAVSMYATRLLVDAASGLIGVPHLELATVALDATTVVLAALYLAALLRRHGASDAARSVKVLAGIYAGLTVAVLVVVANVSASRHGFLPHGVGSAIRGVATLGFVGIGVAAYASVQRLVRAARA
jgi:hypothetical protein